MRAVQVLHRSASYQLLYCSTLVYQEIHRRLQVICDMCEPFGTEHVTVQYTITSRCAHHQHLYQRVLHQGGDSCTGLRLSRNKELNGGVRPSITRQNGPFRRQLSFKYPQLGAMVSWVMRQ